MPRVDVTAPDGTPGTLDASEVQEATAHGYKVATPAPAIGPSAESLRTKPEELTAPNVETASKGLELPVMLRDKATGEVAPVEPFKVAELLASGSHDVADPAAKIQVVSPDGELGTVDAGELRDSLTKGGFHLPSSGELEHEGIASQAKEGLGAGTAALLGLGAPMQGLVEAVGQKTGLLPEDLSGAHQAAEVAEQEHPGAYWTSRVAGELAGAYALGGLGEGASGLAGAKGLGKIAIEGAVYSAPEVMKGLVEKDPAAAAEALALGVGGNIGLHAVFSMGSKVLGRLAEPTASAAASGEELRIAENTAMKGLGVPVAKREAARPMLKELMDEAGIAAGDSKKVAIQKIQSLEDSGPRVGAAMKALDRAEGKSEIISRALSKTNQELATISAKALEVGDEQTVNALKAIEKRVSVLSRKPDVGFDHTQDLKSWVGGQARFGADNSVELAAKRDAYTIVRNNLMEAENQAAEKVGGSGVLEGLKADRFTYKLHKFFGDYAEREGSKEVTEAHSFHLARHGFAAMAGHFIGLPAPISVALSVGEQALRKRINGNVFGNAVKAIKGSTTPNTSLALDSMKALDDHIGTQVKGLFSALVSREAAKHTDVLDDTISHLLPNRGSGQSHDTQVKVLRRAAAQYKTDPGGVADHLAEVVAPLRQEGLDKVADAYTEHQLRLMKVIDSVLPADPELAQAHPFASSVIKEDISPAARAQYTRDLQIATDPTKLLGLVKANAISMRDVAIAAASNPSALAKMRTALVDDAMSRKPDLTYQHRISMAILMGTYLDESTRQLPVLQSAFSAPMPTGTTGTPKPIKTDDKRMDEQASAFLPDSAKGIVSAR